MSWFVRVTALENNYAPPAPPAEKSGGAEKSPWLQAAPPAPPAPPENCNNLKLLAEVRQTLEQFAIDLGFQWNELLDAGVVAELDVYQFANDWNKNTPEQWRCYINSIGLRARHGCPGLANRPTCNCGGKCRAFGEQS